MNATALAIDGFAASTATPVLPVPQRQLRPGLLRKALSTPLPKRPPAVISNDDREGTVVSFEQSSTPLESLGDRLSAALRRRVGNGRAITVKQLAYAIQVSETTVWNLLSGNNEPRGDTLLKLLSFFDSAFANEILGHTGCVIAKLSDARVADAIRRYNEARADVLAHLGNGTEE